MPTDQNFYIQEINTFLKRNLSLPKSYIKFLKQKSQEASLEKQENIYKILKNLDQIQTQTIQQKLEENPHFFKKLENIIQKSIQQENTQKEQVERQNIESQLESALEKIFA